MEQVPFDSATSTLVLVNPAANRGRAQRVGDAITNVLVERGVAAKKVFPSTISATRELVKEAIDREVRVVAVGGDGLVHHVVQEIAETSTALGIVPAGTGNDFASALRLPTSVDEMATAATGDSTAIDVLKMTDAAGAVRYATTIATAGFSAAVNVRAERLRWPLLAHSRSRREFRVPKRCRAADVRYRRRRFVRGSNAEDGEEPVRAGRELDGPIDQSEGRAEFRGCL